MPVYRQTEKYEAETAPEEEEQEAPVEEQEEEAEDTEEEEEKPKKKKAVKKRSKSNTKMIAALCIGITALLVLVVVAAIGVNTKRKQAEQKKAEEEQMAQLADYYANEPTDETQEGETVQETVVPSTTSYTDKELKALRKWGYTASEIEVSAANGLSAKELVASARADREEAQKEALAAVSDTASDEYKNLLYSTWLGGEPLDVSGFTENIAYIPSTRVENVDYTKVAATNQQCFVRLELDNGYPAFMFIDPDRYNELADTGNMVVQITTVVSGETEVITDISEQRVD